MAVVCRRLLVFTTSLDEGQEQRSGEGGSVEDGRCGPWAELQTRTSRSGLMKIMEVLQDDGTQYVQRAAKTVMGFGSMAGDVLSGYKDGAAHL
ncbi:hypothetical protein DPMN_183139 [Dreissena polymorpha]|uniref:Uncharacterized protein n=1 Tax=Dreissena polymorpha TaxID=45954 RepID=A0A9D4I586_DREPO|nr:hypothetical protein DPMN_183139 [Dreissena polymorpha]